MPCAGAETVRLFEPTLDTAVGGPEGGGGSSARRPAKLVLSSTCEATRRSAVVRRVDDRARLNVGGRGRGVHDCWSITAKPGGDERMWAARRRLALLRPGGRGGRGGATRRQRSEREPAGERGSSSGVVYSRPATKIYQATRSCLSSVSMEK